MPLVFVASILLFASCGPEDVPGAASRAGVMLEGARARLWRPGEAVWTAAARTAEIRGDLEAARLGDVHLEADGQHLSGTRATVDLSAHRLELDGTVKATLSGAAVAALPADAGGVVPVEIAADRFLGRSKEGVGTFEGHVVATRGSMKMTCERLAVEYDREHRRIDRMVATGAVEIESGARRCSGRRVVFDQRAQRVVMEGMPVLREGRDEMRGERIVWDLETDQIDCQRCRVRWEPRGEETSPAGRRAR